MSKSQTYSLALTCNIEQLWVTVVH